MDTVNSLLEGASPYKVLQNQSAKLVGKWGKSGLLEGIESSTESNNMAILLENQAKQLVNEASSTGTGTSTAPKKEVISESSDMMKRFQKLANIKINQ